MSDKVYITDNIPDDFNYAQFSNGYITLYNQQSADNEDLEYYRLHYDYSSGLVTHGYQSFTYPVEFEFVETSRHFFDRPDSFSIVFILLVLCVFGLWLFNLFTSLVKHNGLLSGLL